MTLIFFCSCERVKNKGEELVELSKTEIDKASKKAWDNTVDFALEELSYTEKITLKDIYSSKGIPELKLVESIQINYPLSFYSCYFKYKADKVDVLKFLSDLNTAFPDISDSKYQESNGKEIKKNLEFIELKMSKLKKEISFFFEINSIEKVEYFRCNKYPHANYLAVDVKNGTIYHLIEKYWD